MYSIKVLFNTRVVTRHCSYHMVRVFVIQYTFVVSGLTHTFDEANGFLFSCPFLDIIP